MMEQAMLNSLICMELGGWCVVCDEWVLSLFVWWWWGCSLLNSKKSLFSMSELLND